MQEKNYIVYKHTSPSNKIYIGITCQNPKKRWANGKGYWQNNYFTKAINKYGWNNFTHEILFENLTREEACQKETELIASYKSNQREFGYNLSAGGEKSAAGSRKINKTFFNKFKVLNFENGKYTLLCLDCNKTFERTDINNQQKTKCPFEIPLNHYITYKGETLTATEWSKKLNIPTETIIYREKHKLDLVVGRVNKIRILIECPICGKQFKRKDKDNKFCSAKCQYENYKKYSCRKENLKAKREKQKQYYQEHKKEREQYRQQYFNRLCLYNGETLTLNALSKRFGRKGISNPTQEAKKYLMEVSNE